MRTKGDNGQPKENHRKQKKIQKNTKGNNRKQRNMKGKLKGNQRNTL